MGVITQEIELITSVPAQITPKNNGIYITVSNGNNAIYFKKPVSQGFNINTVYKYEKTVSNMTVVDKDNQENIYLISVGFTGKWHILIGDPQYSMVFHGNEGGSLHFKHAAYPRKTNLTFSIENQQINYRYMDLQWLTTI